MCSPFFVCHKELGHNVVSAAEIGYSQATDLDLLDVAQEQGRILVTRDRDFGGLAFVRGLGAGVIYLRIPPLNLDVGHKELATVLASYSENELEPGGQAEAHQAADVWSRQF